MVILILPSDIRIAHRPMLTLPGQKSRQYLTAVSMRRHDRQWTGSPGGSRRPCTSVVMADPPAPARAGKGFRTPEQRDQPKIS
jgi:hypothetical protein